MTFNIRFCTIKTSFLLTAASLVSAFVEPVAYASKIVTETISACVLTRQEMPFNTQNRATMADCLGWESDYRDLICQGHYTPISVTDVGHYVSIHADTATLNADGPSTLSGHVEVKQNRQILSAQTATVYRDAKTNQITRIKLFGGIRVKEPGRLLIAKQATVKPRLKTGVVENVLYRFDFEHAHADLPAWGRANWVERFPNQDYLLRKVTYTTCSPNDKAWRIDADKIKIHDTIKMGEAQHAVLLFHDLPVFYVPYLSFPTSNERKSGALMPTIGYSDYGGFDLALPYYLNLAPNYDATITPHVYSQRGLMMGGEFRFLTETSNGFLKGYVLPNDRAYKDFLRRSQTKYPILQGASDTRWAYHLLDGTDLTPNLHLNIDVRDVSDDYYFQDFSSNLAVTTENQLLHRGSLTYTTDHWRFRGMLQRYETLHPVNRATVSDVYELLPQISAMGHYLDLPLHTTLNILGEYDDFHWPIRNQMTPEGARYHISPVLSMPLKESWGYLTPTVELVEDNYKVRYVTTQDINYYNRAIPRFSVDSGLVFERPVYFGNTAHIQTLEPRLYYLNVPFYEQVDIPNYSSSYMTFTADQLFRNNRFSGFDRIGDANQLTYALTSRLLSDRTGSEKASITVGQIRYFKDRRVKLCYARGGNCVDNPLSLGSLSTTSAYSPIAARGVYRVNNILSTNAGFVWDTTTHEPNNANLDLHYHPEENHILSLKYSYLVNGNLLRVADHIPQSNALHQITGAYAWPLNENWSTLGAYSYNISKRYDMLSFFGVQYDSCCWAMRILGSRSFRSLNTANLAPEYNNNVYIQLLLKGIGSLSTNDPMYIIGDYLTSYQNKF